MDIKERFAAVNKDFLVFEKVEPKRSNRPDIHAFILLDELFPKPGYGIISGATDDEISLDVKKEDFDNLTDEQILELVRCGVRYAGEYNCLAMYTLGTINL